MSLRAQLKTSERARLTQYRAKAQRPCLSTKLSHTAVRIFNVRSVGRRIFNVRSVGRRIFNVRSVGRVSLGEQSRQQSPTPRKQTYPEMGPGRLPGSKSTRRFHNTPSDEGMSLMGHLVYPQPRPGHGRTATHPGATTSLASLGTTRQQGFQGAPPTYPRAKPRLLSSYHRRTFTQARGTGPLGTRWEPPFFTVAANDR